MHVGIGCPGSPATCASPERLSEIACCTAPETCREWLSRGGSPGELSERVLSHSGSCVDDLWAVAVLAYRATVGKTPFLKDTLAATIESVVKEVHSSLPSLFLPFYCSVLVC